MKLHNQIFLAMALGALAGWLTSEGSQVFGVSLLAVYDTVGRLFINGLQMIVVPLITSAIISSLTGLGNGRDLGRLGGKTIAYYMSTTFVAIIIGLVISNLLTPGIIDGEPAGDRLGLAADTHEVLARVEGRGAGDFAGIILQLLPSNLLQAAVQGQLLGLIVFSLLFGYFLRNVEGSPGQALRDAIEGLYQTMVRITLFIIRFAPIGVFALIAATVTRTGFDAIEPLAWFFACVLLALAVHAFIVLPLAICVLGRRSPTWHLRAMTPAMLTAFSTASSAATLPLTMECVEKRSRVSKRIATFVLPLGSTVNMDGTALYECAAVLFIAQAYGLDLSLGMQALVVITALLTSIGVASIPAASLVAITLILGMVGLPAEAIGLILVTDRVLDMCRTAVNIWSDSVGAVLIARSEGEEAVLSQPPDHTV
ncbi:excitatory amino acid transporter [Isoalcanivorax pacificus W11-5]|uniref:Excitatory amino acid transporter n=1 Tax=Isoalcanivorax pacificus W11-5 TaxID=391936 RepID=A0A0B4XNK0_9GAMM|nr:dicarboxylate/amino acid:cation symporter [Isoalcanivorax pacificus]AJD48043.1 excitatory amino acid transporter [Isoalcanivorax pacificus W11-5]